ncbi:hypothetical protein C6A37_06720 [Desulfobacteraceae bacterium SEEP-SAG9]|nr:hypothetical protein C6A37_06720 [Desulfobacteraceae bacterium SEEP-SAG9]
MKTKRFFMEILLILIILAAFPFGSSAEEVTIVCEVNDSYQLVGEDGQIYEVAVNEIGNEVVQKLISQIVKVTGTVKEKEGEKIITILSYEVLAE